MVQQKVDLEHLWKDAVHNYLGKTKQKSTSQKWTQPMTTKADLDKLIKQHEADFAHFRSSHRSLFTILSATMRQLQNFGGIAQAAVQLSPFAPTGVILQAGLGLVHASVAVSDTYDDLETLFARIKAMTDRIEKYIQGPVDENLQKILVDFLVLLLDVFGEKQAAIRRGRSKEWVSRVLSRENKVQLALKRIDELVQTEIVSGVATIQSTTQRIEKKIDNERDDRDRKLLRHVLGEEAIADNEKFGKNIETSRFSQSGAWLLEEEPYKQWFAMRFPILWILGGLGTGKTYLASRIISEIHKKSRLVGYFYMRESMSSQHTLEVILKAISYQIASLQDTYRERMAKMCNDSTTSISGMIWEELFAKLLVKPFSDEAANPVFIIIDGVDEATRADQELVVKLAKKLSDLRYASRKHPALQLLVLGRPDIEYDINIAWKGEKLQPDILHIQPFMSKPDIERFIEAEVAENVHLLQKLPPKDSERLKMHIVDTISSSSGGMFLLAKLMLTEVENMNKPRLIQDALRKLPKGLEGMFQRVVTRIDTKGGFDKQDLNELIMWVACAKRDLLLGELDLILKLRDVNQHGIIGLEEELKTRFGSIFSVISTETDVDGEDQDIASVRESPGTSDSGGSSEGEESFDMSSEDEFEICSDEWKSAEDVPDNYFTATVNFSHASVGQHFRRAPLHNGIGMDLNFAQAHIALICSRSLTSNLPKIKQRSYCELGLFDYSVCHILDHIEEVDFEQLKSHHPDIYGSLSEALVALFTDLPSIDRWFSELKDMRKFINQLLSQSICTRLSHVIADTTNPHENMLISPGTEHLKVEQSLKSLLEPLAHYVNDRWLRSKKSCDGMEAILFLRGFVSLRDTEHHKHCTLSSSRPFELIAQTITPEEIRSMASLSGLKKDRRFHRKLGATFARIKTPQHLQAAVEEFESAIRQAKRVEKTWKIQRDKARVYFLLGAAEKALTADLEALRYLPEGIRHDGRRRELLRLISNTHLQLGDRHAAFEAARESWRSAPNDPLRTSAFIVIASQTRRFSEVTKIMQSVLESSAGAELLNRVIGGPDLQRFMVQRISFACVATGGLNFTRGVFQAMQLQAHASSDIMAIQIADAALAPFYFEFDREDEKAIALWEDIVESYPSTPSAFDASHALMLFYFSNAQKADATELPDWVSKMVRLVDAVESMVSHEYTYGISRYEAATVLSQWYKTQGEMEKARARVRPLIRESIMDLTDQDDSNDYMAYHRLGRALLSIGDRLNAAISYAFTKPLHSRQEVQSKILRSENEWNMTVAPSIMAGVEHQGTSNFFGHCDGHCDRREDDFTSWKLCETCLDVSFCDECYPKVKNGTTPFRVCDPKHPYLEIYPPRGLVTKGLEGYRVHLDDGREVSDDEWLAMISREWM